MSNLEITRAERLDQYVMRHVPVLSRMHASTIIQDGAVTVNGKTNLKPGYKIRTGDQIKITYSEAEAMEIPHIDLPVLYEDEDCVVIIKPVGLLTHSKGAFNPEATVASWLLEHLGETNLPLEQSDRIGIVHRLDRATSGVMICAKNKDALSWLQKQFAQRRTKKAYAAVVTGVFKQDEAMIDMPIERNPKKPQCFRVGSNGKSAQTLYKVLRTDGTYSLLDLKPTTGRTHQLRVHLEHLGHPIVGDSMYGGQPADRMYLHAKSLELTLPNRERKVFEAPVPLTFEELVKS
jgi:23S rRNA pseudouridine1911/1915/1917 synthase